MKPVAFVLVIPLVAVTPAWADTCDDSLNALEQARQFCRNNYTDVGNFCAMVPDLSKRVEANCPTIRARVAVDRPVPIPDAKPSPNSDGTVPYSPPPAPPPPSRGTIYNNSNQAEKAAATAKAKKSNDELQGLFGP